jgi:ribosome-binding factor A
VDEKETTKGLKSAAGFIRGQVAKRLNLRQTPEFTFLRDRSMENGAHISKLLRSVEADLRDDEPETEESEV